MTEGICYKFQSAPKFAAFESLQALRASVPTPFGPSGHFPLTGGIGSLGTRGAFLQCLPPGFLYFFRKSCCQTVLVVLKLHLISGKSEDRAVLPEKAGYREGGFAGSRLPVWLQGFLS